MLTDEELEYYIEAFQRRIDTVTDKYIELIGRHVSDIGELTPSDLHRVKQMRRMGKNLDEIEREIARVTRLNVEDAKKLLEASATSAYGDFASYGIAAITTNTAMKAIVRAQVAQTAGAMANLSNTTVVSDAYKKCVDTAISAVQTGVADYKSAMRSTIKEASKEGLRVRYESGLTRRLDTSVRQNILDGTKQMALSVAREAGKQFGADGVEISAHTDCAPDHLFLQGQQLSIKEFDRLQGTLNRPVGEWNCRHFAFPIIMGISQPAYSKAELAELRAQTTEKIEIDSVTKTRYQWTQKQRELETQARYAKNEANACKAAGDDAGRRDAQARINEIDRYYAKMSKAAGIPMRRERMQVAGFRRVSKNVGAPQSSPSKVAKASVKVPTKAPAGSRFAAQTGSAQREAAYTVVLESRFASGTQTAQKAYDRYVPSGGAVSDGFYGGTAHYRPVENDIEMDFAKDAANKRGAGVTWFHEHGHYIDHAAGHVSSNAAYRDAILADYGEYVKNYMAGKNIKIADARNDIGMSLCIDGAKKSSISDLFEGASGGKCVGMYGHGRSYWTKNPDALTNEAFAHMLEAEFDADRRALMQSFFPTAFAEFEKILGGIIP